MRSPFTQRLFVSCVLQALLMPVSSQSFEVEKAAFSQSASDDFSPVYYGDGLVFISTRESGIQGEQSPSDRIKDANIWYLSKADRAEQASEAILWEDLLTPFNDGPATFGPGGLEIFYSRNLDVDPKTRDVFDSRNQLGLFSATWVDGNWSEITPFPYNSDKYSITTPALSADGQRIYFASDMPGGSGAADLWYCERSDEGWFPPVNMGSDINTRGNESYPFESVSGVLFFASDGLKGFGKKDIFLTREIEGEWTQAVNLDARINSKEDDFGLVTGPNSKEGYFSSNRDKSDDIYHFVTQIPLMYDCDSLLKNFYCYQFSDESIVMVDSLPLSYQWMFSDGESATGTEVEHCFPGAGNYVVELHIIDNNTGNTFFTQNSFEVEITDEEQPYINSPDALLRKQETAFDALATNLPHMEVDGYYWDFGDGMRLKGSEVVHTFQKKGSYKVKLGVVGKPDSTGLEPKECVYKIVEVLQDNQDLAIFQARQKGLLVEFQDSAGREAGISKTFYSMEEDQAKDAVFRVEVLNSDSKISIDSAVFDPLRGEYDIKEVFLREDSHYSYTVGESQNVIGSYEVYNDVVERGFENARVKSYILADLAEEELLQLTTALGNFSDAYFEFDDYRIGEASYPILDQVVVIMNRYPTLKMEIAAHTDNVGSFEYNMNLSQRRAQSMIDYLVAKGIDASRLIGKGYGHSRPIASNTTEEGKMLNRRVEFIILDER